jgi:hypothetical protein
MQRTPPSMPDAKLTQNNIHIKQADGVTGHFNAAQVDPRSAPVSHNHTRYQDMIKNINKIIVGKRVCVSKITIRYLVVGKITEIGHVSYCSF